MIPATSPSSEPSNAERKVFEALAKTHLGPSAALHSLRLTKHAYKAVGEIDFLVVSPQAVLVLEVKGGGVTVDEAGIWHYVDRFGIDHESREGPFKQAESARFALSNRRDEKGVKIVPRSVPIGHGVIFPDCEFRQESIEWDREMILSSRELREAGIKPFLLRLIDYWVSKYHANGELEQHSLDKLVNALRPSFDVPVSIAARAADLEAEISRFTDAQLAVIEAASTQPRVLCTGGAGTGKTILALDVVRRLVESGRRSAYSCKSPLLARAARRQLPPEVAVLTLDQLASHEAPLDAIVLDEAQDLTDGTELFDVMSSLTGGLESGCWYAFADPNNQAGLYSPNSGEVRELLELAASGFTIHLTRNCRNSFEVVVNTQLLTGADIGEARAGDGIGVKLEYFDTTEDEIASLERYLESLLNADVLPRDIAVLRWAGTPELHPNLPPRLRSLIEDIGFDSAPVSAVGTTITEASIVDFKGLEASFVAIAGCPVSPPENFTEQIYTALTRAKAGAWIGLPRALEPEITRRQLSNLRAVNDVNG